MWIQSYLAYTFRQNALPTNQFYSSVKGNKFITTISTISDTNIFKKNNITLSKLCLFYLKKTFVALLWKNPFQHFASNRRFCTSGHNLLKFCVVIDHLIVVLRFAQWQQQVILPTIKQKYSNCHYTVVEHDKQIEQL